MTTMTRESFAYIYAIEQDGYLVWIRYGPDLFEFQEFPRGVKSHLTVRLSNGLVYSGVPVPKRCQIRFKSNYAHIELNDNDDTVVIEGPFLPKPSEKRYQGAYHNQ